MSSSHANSRRETSAGSIAKSQERIADHPAIAEVPLVTGFLPGTMNDASLVRMVVAESMRQSGLSRDTIADRMTELAGTSVTPNMLNGFAAESRSDVRFPCELVRAFCAAVSNDRLLTCLSELSGLTIVDQTALDLMELGRQYLIEKRAAIRREGLEGRLQGVSL